MGIGARGQGGQLSSPQHTIDTTDNQPMYPEKNHKPQQKLISSENYLKEVGVN
jgi:hypothetical protein